MKGRESTLRNDDKSDNNGDDDDDYDGDDDDDDDVDDDEDDDVDDDDDDDNRCIFYRYDFPGTRPIWLRTFFFSFFSIFPGFFSFC